MSYTYTGYAHAFPTTSTPVFLDAPNAVISPGLFLVLVSIGDITRTAIPTHSPGWVQIASTVGSNDTVEVRVCTKVVTAFDVAQGGVTLPGDAGFNGLHHHLWGFFADNPLQIPMVDAVAVAQGSPTTVPDTIVVIPSVTVTEAENVVVVATGTRDPGSSWASIDPIITTVDLNDPSSYISGLAGGFIKSGTGATGTLNATILGSNNGRYASATIAVKDGPVMTQYGLNNRGLFVSAFNEGRTTRKEFIKAPTVASTAVPMALTRFGPLPAALTAPATTPGTPYTSSTQAITFPDCYPYERRIVSIEAALQSTSTVGATLFFFDLIAACRFTMAAGTITIGIDQAESWRYILSDYAYNGRHSSVWVVPTATTAASTVSMNYGDTGGVNRTGATLSIPVSDPAHSMYQLPLDAAANQGVTTVATLTCGSGSGTYDLYLVRPLAHLLIPPTNAQTQVFNKVSYLDDCFNPIPIPDGACIQVAVNPGSTTTIIQGAITTVFG